VQRYSRILGLLRQRDFRKLRLATTMAASTDESACEPEARRTGRPACGAGSWSTDRKFGTLGAERTAESFRRTARDTHLLRSSTCRAAQDVLNPPRAEPGTMLGMPPPRHFGEIRRAPSDAKDDLGSLPKYLTGNWLRFAHPRDGRSPGRRVSPYPCGSSLSTAASSCAWRRAINSQRTSSLPEFRAIGDRLATVFRRLTGSANSYRWQ
jgi:hypothetical protein